jgi:hypothetical protein
MSQIDCADAQREVSAPGVAHSDESHSYCDSFHWRRGIYNIALLSDPGMRQQHWDEIGMHERFINDSYLPMERI